MGKKTIPSSESTAKGHKKTLWVVETNGVRHCFLRGMVTHDLIQQGLNFDDAYAIARAIRDRLGDRNEVTSAEIKDLIQDQLESMFGQDFLASPIKHVKPVATRQVIYHGQRQPFSRGLLARSIYAAGLTLDRAYRLVTELEKALQEEDVTIIPSYEVARRIGELLESFESKESARRYRLVRRIHRLPQPLVIFVGGASGTGKSTLALELAPLLRIYRINSTDTIRQVMRMVFSPAILPALHSSSFEVAAPHDYGFDEVPPGYPRDPNFAQRLIATFDEQATRVCVGVRAVVERAVAENMSILVEGVHLVPPLIPFGDLDSTAYQVPLMVGTLNEEIHRDRFLLRSREGGRLAERYVESFPSIRAIHDFLLQQAEAHGMPLIDNSHGEEPVVRMLRLVTSVLEQQLPSLARTALTKSEIIVPTLLLTIDGLADRPVNALEGQTPLQAAKTPTLDRLAREGQSGLADPMAPGIVSDMASGTLSLFGHSPMSMKRGPIEAMGAGIQLLPGDIALRGNFATLNHDGAVIDRRAGRIHAEVTKLAESLDRLSMPDRREGEIEVRVKPVKDHRLAIVLRGEGLSSAIQGSDPGETPTPATPLTPQPLDPNDPRAIYTAKVLSEFEEQARQVLKKHPINRSRELEKKPPANAILTRGAGRAHRLVPIEHAGIPIRLTCVSSDKVMLALATWLGAETLVKKGMTEDIYTDMESKLATAAEALSHSDLVVVHLQGVDVSAQEPHPELKVAFLEKIDRALTQFLESYEGSLRIAVASDHAHLSESGQDVADPLPILIWGEGVQADQVQAFSEKAAAIGELKRFPLQLLLGKLFELN